MTKEVYISPRVSVDEFELENGIMETSPFNNNKENGIESYESLGSGFESNKDTDWTLQ